MAAFGTVTERFTGLFDALIKSDGGFLNMLNNTAIVPDATRAGAVTTRITTAVTLQTTTDGTLLANNAARTEVALTAFEGAHTISLFEYQLAQFDGAAERAEVRAFTSAARVLAETTVIADLVAGTPGDAQTLPDGQMNFTTTGTDAQAYIAVDKLNAAIAYVDVNKAIGGNTFILLNPTSYRKMISLRGTSRLRDDFDREGTFWFYLGLPIFKTSVTTNFGAATKAAAFVVHSDAEALAWTDVYLPHEEFRHYGDGMWKLFMKTYGFAGLIQGSSFAEVLNGAS
ncbi:MAG TPA: hypothetical protein VM223_27165 [Planctomycetota bacterium]|nr:hypothetical protein [Planctomycetota bacterium]